MARVKGTLNTRGLGRSLNADGHWASWLNVASKV